MKVLTLKRSGNEISFVYADHELEYNDSGTIGKLTFYKEDESQFVEVGCTNKPSNLSVIEYIRVRKLNKKGITDTYNTIDYNEIVIAGKRFMIGQVETELQSFVKSSAMPITKAKQQSILKSLKASKESQIEKQAATTQPKRDLKAFVNANKVKSDEAVRRDELVKSVYTKLKKNQPEQAEQKQQTLADYITSHKTSDGVNAQAIIEKMRRQSAPKADFNKQGNMVIDGQEICLTKAHDLQLLSITQYIEKHLGSLDKLTINQQWDYVEFIKSLTTIKDAIQLEKLATNFVNKILGK
ncbi:TPA: hypothetical protein ACMDQP_003099 [Vibrio cholerae]